MEYTKETPRKDITIQKVTLSVISPYAAGHVLTENEANVLNQTFSENIRNNFAPFVKKAIDEVSGDVSAVNVKEMQKALEAYLKEYEFGVRRSGGGSSRVVDPVERKALAIAKEQVRGLLKRKGLKVTSVSAEDLTALAEKLLERNPAIMEEAKRQVEATQKVADKALGAELDSLLDSVTSTEAGEKAA